LPSQNKHSFVHKQAGEEIFEPKRTRIFEMMDGIAHDDLGHDRGAGRGEIQFHVATIAAFERCGNVPLKRHAATAAKWRADEFHVTSALRAHETFVLRSRFILAKSADLGIKKSERGVQCVLEKSLQSMAIVHPAA
jgi:hypothetical protein